MGHLILVLHVGLFYSLKQKVNKPHLSWNQQMIKISLADLKETSFSVKRFCQGQSLLPNRADTKSVLFNSTHSFNSISFLPIQPYPLIHCISFLSIQLYPLIHRISLLSPVNADGAIKLILCRGDSDQPWHFQVGSSLLCPIRLLWPR